MINSFSNIVAVDDIHIANKLIDSRKRFKKSDAIFKIDKEKARDQVDWDFVLIHVTEVSI